MKPLSQKSRFEILRKHGFTCQYCGAKAPNVELQIDHIIPKSGGGGNNVENLTVACFACNFGKLDRGLEDGIKKSRSKVGRPPLPPDQQPVPIGYKVTPEAAKALDTLAERWGISKRKALEGALMQALAKEMTVPEYYCCAYCPAEISEDDAAQETIPALSDDEAWEKLGKLHHPACEWIETRAHRI